MKLGIPHSTKKVPVSDQRDFCRGYSNGTPLVDRALALHAALIPTWGPNLSSPQYRARDGTLRHLTKINGFLKLRIPHNTSKSQYLIKEIDPSHSYSNGTTLVDRALLTLRSSQRGASEGDTKSFTTALNIKRYITSCLTNGMFASLLYGQQRLMSHNHISGRGAALRAQAGKSCSVENTA